MFFLDKLNTLGKVIYFSTMVIDVAILLFLSLKYPELSVVIRFVVFAGIWIAGSILAGQLGKKN